jgi:hypothetical protein
MIVDNTKPSDSPSYNGTPNPIQTSGTLQTAGAVITNVIGASTFKEEVFEGVSAASFVTVAGQDERLQQVGTRQQYSLQISLSGDAGGYALTPSLTDAQGNPSTPVGNYFAYYSRQRLVATVVDGIITPVARGSCVVEVRWPVGQVNVNFVGATSNPSNFIYATIALTVTE